MDLEDVSGWIPRTSSLAAIGEEHQQRTNKIY